MKRRTTTARTTTSRATTSRATTSRTTTSRTATTRRKKLIVVNPENYTDVTVSLSERLTTRAPVNYERGRDRMRQHLVDTLELTPTRARHIVSALVQKGFVRFGPHPNYGHDHTVGCWTYHPNAKR